MPDIPTTCSCAAIREASRHLTRFYDDALASVGLSLNQYSVLAKLDRLGPQSLQELADLLAMDRSSLGHLLRPLERRRLVRIAVAAGDRRRRKIELADEGIALMRRAQPLWRDAETRFQAGFGPDDAHHLRAVLARITTLDLST